MSKTHRGKGLREAPARGRGTCPVCKRTGVKLLWDGQLNTEKARVCKKCRGKK